MAKGKKTGGRRPGSINKTTALMKDAIAEAFHKRGGVPALLSWADENPTAFYTQLCGRLIPVESHVSGADGAPLGVVVLPAVKG